MSYRIYRIEKDTSRTQVEEHSGPVAATRAMLLLTAHDLKNDRTSHYYIEPATFTSPEEISRMEFPGWAEEILRNEGLL